MTTRDQVAAYSWVVAGYFQEKGGWRLLAEERRKQQVLEILYQGKGIQTIEHNRIENLDLKMTTKWRNAKEAFRRKEREPPRESKFFQTSWLG